MNSGINRGTVVMCDTLDMDNASDSESGEELVNPTDDSDASLSTSEYEM